MQFENLKVEFVVVVVSDDHEITVLERRMLSEDPATRYTLTLHDLPVSVTH